jgi:hypothetical protein
MNSLNLSRCALSVCVAAIVLAGCGGSQTPTASSPLTATNAGTVRIGPALGGAFAARYSRYLRGRCLWDQLCWFRLQWARQGVVSRPEQGVWLTAVYLRRTVQGSGYANEHPQTGQYHYVQLSGGPPYPCQSPLSWTVTGGTGKFVHATGSGTVTFKCVGATYSDKWSGTLTATSKNRSIDRSQDVVDLLYYMHVEEAA